VKTTVLFFLLAVMMWCMEVHAYTRQAYIVDAGFSTANIGKNLAWFEDKAGDLTIDDIIREPVRSRFNHSMQENPGFGFRNSVIWVRFTIANDTGVAREFYVEQAYPLIDDLRFYTPREQQYSETVTGDMHPFSKRPIIYRTLVFPLQVKANSESTCFLRYHTSSSINIELILRSPEAFVRHVYNDTSLRWMFYGLLIVMALYNLFLFASIRDTSYLYYVMFIISFTLFFMALDGITFQSFWPDSLWWANYCVVVFEGCSVATYSLFVWKFIPLVKKMTVPRAVFLVITALCISFILLALAIDGYAFGIKALTVLAGVSSLWALVYISITAFLFKIREARLFFFSFVVFLIAAFNYALLKFALVPNNFFTTNGITIGFAFAAIQLSLALADRINVMGKELLNLNTGLEQKVEERTHDLAQANERLKEIDKLKTNFFANISHEIRTPLTLILSPLESALQGDYGKKFNREFLESIHRNAVRLLRLINNILDFAKIEEGRMIIQVREVDLAALVKNYITTISSAAESRGITLSFTSSVDSLPFFLDIEKADKIAMNLFSNALKFTERGGAIVVSLYADILNCYLEVADTGAGIPSEKIPSIFDRFTQADSSSTRKYEGTGIGLSLVKELVELHGGHITVESRFIGEHPQDHGTRFTISFPRGKEHLLGRYDVEFITGSELEESVTDSKRVLGMRELIDLQEPGAAPAERAPGEERAAKLHKVLVVEDNVDMRNFLGGLLCKYYTVAFAVDGRDGLEKIRSLQPDIIITDVMMPNMDGYQMTKHIKENSILKRIPVLMLTAKSDIAQKIEGLEYGADDYLTKPFNSKELQVRIKNLIGKRDYEKVMEIRQQEITSELKTARLLQQNLLPEMIPEIPGYRFHVAYIPMDLVGGDFYDIKIDDRRIKLFIADVSGHGLPGAFLATITKIALESIGSRNTPRQVLELLNDVVKRSTVENKYVSTFYCTIDRSTNMMRYSNAGQIPPLVYRQQSDEFFELMTKGTPLGWFKELNLEEKEILLTSGDRVLFYTDGIVESRDPSGNLFGFDRFMEFIRSEKKLPPEQFTDRLLAELKKFTGSNAFKDDLCLLVVDIL
jgi:signal transduction histidine kinase/DNA-binding NarL/FixJ family response regulator